MSLKKRSITRIVIPLILCVIYASLCLPSLHNTLGSDEAFSAYFIRGDITEIWRVAWGSGYSPLFYTVLKIWSVIFGNTDASLRFMSVFFGAIAIIFAFYLLKRWFGTKIASLGSALLAFSPIFISASSKIGRNTIFFAIIIFVICVLTKKLKKISFFKNPLKLNPIIIPIFAVAILTEIVSSGIMNLSERNPDSYVKEIVATIDDFAENGEPIVADELKDYYDGVFYSTDVRPIYIFYDHVDPNDSTSKPAETYRYNIIENPETFANTYKKFWYITNPSEDKTETLLAGYHVINEVKNSHHLALELERE